MRPARKGPENQQAPVKPVSDRLASMRPARKGPENHINRNASDSSYARFNEAGPQGAGKPAAGRRPRARSDGASMRPARKGPENPGLQVETTLQLEAASMRPARKGPENPATSGINANTLALASMRPARKGPENRFRCACSGKLSNGLQ